MTQNTEIHMAQSQQSTTDTPSPEALRVEYQAAQDSAQHHDDLVWSVTSVMWGGSLILMGFILATFKEASLRPLVSVLSLLGIALTICVWIFAFQLGAVKRHKYARCKEIEEILHLKQHTTLRWPSGSGRVLYGLLMTSFLAAWVMILWTAWSCRPS